jgi:hypothetical protein
MSEPKFSEVLRAAARGYLRPYQPDQSQWQSQAPGLGRLADGQYGQWPTFNTSDYQTAKSVAAAFNAIADLYEMKGL